MILDLVAIAGLTTTGMISRTSGGAVATRTITGTAGRISITDGGGISVTQPSIWLLQLLQQVTIIRNP